MEKNQPIQENHGREQKPTVYRVDQRRVQRFLASPLRFARRNQSLPLPLFRALADATSLKVIANPSRCEDLVHALVMVGEQNSRCAQSRALGVQAVFHVFRHQLEAAQAAAAAGVDRADLCPYCLGNSLKIRAHVAMARREMLTAKEDLDRAEEFLREIDPAGLAGVYMVRARAVEAEDAAQAAELLMEAHRLTAHYEQHGDPICPSQTSGPRAVSYHSDAGTNLVIVLANSADPRLRSRAREMLPNSRRQYGRNDHLRRGVSWWLEGQLEVDACVAGGLFSMDGVWADTKSAERSRGRVLSRYRHALKSLSEAGAPVELAGLLADIGAVDRNALEDILDGANVLRTSVQAAFKALPTDLMLCVEDLRAAIMGIPAPCPEVAQIRKVLLQAACAEIPDELPANLVARVEDLQESMAVLLSEIAEAETVPPEVRFHRALVALRQTAEAAGAPPAVTPLLKAA